MPHSALVVVANRLPIDEAVLESGAREWRRSPGGLVSALRPILQGDGTSWIGWAGSTGPAPDLPDIDGVALRAVPQSQEEFENYYEGFANSTIWPLYHDAVEQPTFHRRWWEAYQRINRRFAAAAAEAAPPGALVWVQDYHLQLVPAMLRELRPDLRIGFFMHIPFPPPELFKQIPRRADLLRGLLGADLVGFQVPGGARNFVRLIERVLGLRTRHNEIEVDGRVVHVGAFPISVDVGELEELARSEEVRAQAAQIRADLGNPDRILLGVDRLDYTKGIEHRLKAYRELLADGRVKVPNTVLVQVAVPSRERVEHYKALREKVEREVGGINGEYGRLGVPAVHYLNCSYNRAELAALYLAADVMVVTPLRDGMNLVAKEYVACRHDNGGALVLSEFAGAAHELKQAYLVNPHDLDDLKDSLVGALEADPSDTARRMRAMRRYLRTHDVTAWARAYLSALEFPVGL
ncbi:alpha,alpha-trehalose-phosphate synthase (UDP-forming) [Rugosimonospora africana]|uniref:Trehalose-6-phosphate synthase n=1 Tax=Rugosimonospora africana TaxID=556532 RepID=A0A8J3QLY7_9ACTN|nr:trehalose-6-phosphate synthase [Rugosimonospora africana]GIH13394.1 trehalose-6-phosphate synthase [Rugosimonospora africana]